MTRRKNGKNKLAPQRIQKESTPKPTSFFDKKVVRFLVFLLKSFVPMVVLVGIWIYWPRTTHPFVPGFGIEAECSTTIEVSMAVQIISTDEYRIVLDFGDLNRLGCTRLKIIIPSELISVIRLKNVKNVTEEALKNSRQEFTNFKHTRNTFGQSIVEIPVTMFSKENSMFEFQIKGILAESFEKFRLLLPKTFANNTETKLSGKVRINLASIAIPSQFEILDAIPPASSRLRQLGPEFLYFGGKEMSEINILLIDRSRENWKNIFNIFVLAIATSVIAAGISKLTQAQK